MTILRKCKRSRKTVSAFQPDIFNNKLAINEFGFNMVASDAISLDRYPADLRHEECKYYQYPERLPASSVIFVFHNEGWSTLVRSIHSVINFTPPELLEEVVLIDDGSNKEHITGGRLEEHIKQWDGLVKVPYFIFFLSNNSVFLALPKRPSRRSDSCSINRR